MKLSEKTLERIARRLATLLTVLVVVAVIFIGGMIYMNGRAVTSKTNSVVASTFSSTVTLVNDQPLRVVTKQQASSSVPLNIASATAPAKKPDTVIMQIPTSTPVATAPASTSTTSTSVVSYNLPYSIGVSNSFDADDGWAGWWGNVSQTAGVLSIGASATGTGSGAFFTGSYGWSNYSFSATIDWVKGQTFDLIARYQDSDDYVVCSYNEQQVGLVTMNLDQFIDGKQVNLAYGSVSNYNQLGGAGLPVAIEVHGDQGACGFDGHEISTAIDATTLTPTSWGAIGFSTWDPNTNNSEIVVHNVSVISGTYNLQTYGTQTNY
jgi:hypothetical protein